MPVSIPAEPALLGQRYVPFTALRGPAVIMNERTTTFEDVGGRMLQEGEVMPRDRPAAAGRS